MHRIWAFLAGVPLGVLGAFAFGGGSAAALEMGAPIGGLVVLAAVVLAGRLASAEAERGAHLARAASVGWAALPAAACAWLGLAPPAWTSLVAVVLLLAAALVRAARASGPAGSWLHSTGRAAASVVLGGALFLAAAAGFAELGGRSATAAQAQKLATYAYDVDAGVPLAPAFDCRPQVASSQTLGAGANPAFSPDGNTIWFDVADADGRRQIQRMPATGGAPTCWTCGEPGDNRRPRVVPNGSALVFETDRFASALAPVNWELELVGTLGDAPKGARRLTYDPAPDTFGALDPGGRMLVWSSGAKGRYAVATAAFRAGHGGLVLAEPDVVLAGGTAWIAPLAWSPDARALVAVRGDPLGVQEAILLDPARGTHTSITRPGAHVVAASFSADGATLALATTRPAAASLALPASLGFFVARLTALGPGETTRFRGSAVRIGAPGAAELAEVQLGEIADFGHPTGIALAPDGRSFVLGQRRAQADGGEERLLRVALDCPRLP